MVMAVLAATVVVEHTLHVALVRSSLAGLLTILLLYVLMLLFHSLTYLLVLLVQAVRVQQQATQQPSLHAVVSLLPTKLVLIKNVNWVDLCWLKVVYIIAVLHARPVVFAQITVEMVEEKVTVPLIRKY
jgi:hypothetical protein